MKAHLRRIFPYLPAALITGVLLLLYIPDARYYFFSPDQGFQIAVADQILSGNHPWMDVQGGGYGPLVFYSSALGQVLFRGVIAGEVFITFVGYFLGYMMLYLAFYLAAHGVEASIYGMLSIFLVLYCGRQYLRKRDFKYLLLCGVFSGAGVLVRQPVFGLWPVVGLFFLFDRKNEDELTLAKELTSRMNMRALELGGTVTGEHGIGIGKMKYLQAEHGEAVNIMADMKRTLDPTGIMNPGKIVNVN